ncbi:tetratricopeptide repeat protein [Pseudomarimonas arenosa]|uniref:Tetratricopeptide repeat protein n=1 Tax=Pseudomarimonas arenosa TaxID=2774145 RepID=A0AAW3ZK95_9GAMM|nr:tetratricopeptide repeat protein [Pseudomarimonas arenosa]MBD8526178.1 hypothetical protein [Pseudomarimonas arenosa]
MHRLVKLSWLPIAALLAACSASDRALRNDTAADAGSSSTMTAASSWLIVGPRYPLSAGQRVTTDPTLLIGNLQSSISALQQRMQQQPDDVTAASQLSAALLQRAQIIGRQDDTEQALLIAERAVQMAPESAPAWRALATAQAALHRFTAAELSLQKAHAFGLSAEQVLPLQRDIQVAKGDYSGLKSDLDSASRPVGEFAALAHRADLLLLQGDLRGASLWLRTAQDLYHDVNPLPLAWLYTQQGIALLRFGRVSEARVFFAAAHQRLPAYYLATEHLAECEALLGNLDQARKLYVQVIEQTGNPEFMAALADVEQRAGDDSEAQRWRSAADSGFHRLLARDEAAYAAHAIEFWLEQGRLSEEVAALARRNVERRSDLGSLILNAQVEFALGQTERGCRLISRIDAAGLQPPELQDVAGFRPLCSAG